MIFKKSQYVIYEVVEEGTPIRCVYVYSKKETIPLEIYQNVNFIPDTNCFEGNMVYIVDFGVSTYQIFVKNQWYVALMTTNIEHFNNKCIEVRDYKINALIS